MEKTRIAPHAGSSAQSTTQTTHGGIRRFRGRFLGDVLFAFRNTTAEVGLNPPSEPAGVFPVRTLPIEPSLLSSSLHGKNFSCSMRQSAVLYNYFTRPRACLVPTRVSTPFQELMHHVPLRRSDCLLRPRVRPAPLGGMPEKLPFYTLPKKLASRVQPDIPSRVL